MQRSSPYSMRTTSSQSVVMFAAVYQKMDTTVGLSSIASLSLGLSMSMTGAGRAVIENLQNKTSSNVALHLPYSASTSAIHNRRHSFHHHTQLFPTQSGFCQSDYGGDGMGGSGGGGRQRRPSFVGIMQQMSAQSRLLNSRPSSFVCPTLVQNSTSPELKPEGNPSPERRRSTMDRVLEEAECEDGKESSLKDSVEKDDVEASGIIPCEIDKTRSNLVIPDVVVHIVEDKSPNGSVVLISPVSATSPAEQTFLQQQQPRLLTHQQPPTSSISPSPSKSASQTVSWVDSEEDVTRTTACNESDPLPKTSLSLPQLSRCKSMLTTSSSNNISSSNNNNKSDRMQTKKRKFTSLGCLATSRAGESHVYFLTRHFPSPPGKQTDDISSTANNVDRQEHSTSLSNCTQSDLPDDKRPTDGAAASASGTSPSSSAPFNSRQNSDTQYQTAQRVIGSNNESIIANDVIHGHDVMNDVIHGHDVIKHDAKHPDVRNASLNTLSSSHLSIAAAAAAAKSSLRVTPGARFIRPSVTGVVSSKWEWPGRGVRSCSRKRTTSTTISVFRSWPRDGRAPTACTVRVIQSPTRYRTVNSVSGILIHRQGHYINSC